MRLATTPETLLLLAAAAAVAAAIALALGLRLYLAGRAGATARPAAGAVRAGQPHWHLMLGQSDAGGSARGRRLVRAGLYRRDAAELFVAVRITAAVTALALALALFMILGPSTATVLSSLALLGVTLVGPGVWLDRRATRRKREAEAALPQALDLLVTCLDAGLTFEQALERITSGAADSDLLARELCIVLEEMRAGLSSAAAFGRLTERLAGDELLGVATLIGHASSLGSDIGAALQSHARSLRRQRLACLEERVGRASAKMTLPLTLCLFPALLILLWGPAIVLVLGVMER